MWYQLLEDATEGYERSQKVQRIKRGLFKAIDWEFIIIAFIFQEDKEAVLVGTGRWEGDGYRMYLWDGKGNLLEKRDLDAHDMPRRQRFLYMLLEIEEITNGTDFEVYAYQSRYNPVGDTARWREVRL